jgi:ribosomal protein S18 acetylase RimI-like enzyme
MNLALAQQDHIDTLVKFQLMMAEETEGLNLAPSVVLKGVEEIFNDPSKGQYYVYQEEGIIKASLLVLYEWSDWRNGQVLWIHSVYVREEYRNRGIFTSMYRYLQEKVSKDPKLFGIRLYVDQNNTSAKRVYERLKMNDKHYTLFEWLK